MKRVLFLLVSLSLFLLPAFAADWPMFGYDPAHSGNATLETSIANPYFLRWSYDTGTAIKGMAAIANGKLYIGDNTKLTALNAKTGAYIWDYNGASPIKGSPAVVGNNVYFLQGDSKVIACNAGTGAFSWSYTLSTSAGDNLNVSAGKVFVAEATGAGKLYALDASNGNALWSYAGEINYAPAIAGSVVYAGFAYGKVVALSAESGSVLWSYDGGGDPNSVFGSPAVANGVVYSIGANRVHAISASDGSFLWSQVVGQINNTPAISNGVVLVHGDELYAFDANNSGNPLWSYNFEWGNMAGPPVVANGLVYPGFDIHFLGGPPWYKWVTAVSASNGAFKWSYKFSTDTDDNGDGVGGTPVADGRFYFGTTTGRVFCFAETTGAISGTTKKASDATPLAGVTVTMGGRVGTSDASGLYTVSGIAVSNTSASAAISGYVTSTESGVTISSNETTTLDFSLVQNGVFSGTVRKASDNSVLAGATVTASGGPGGGSATTNGSGVYSLDVVPGTYTVSAAKGGYDTSSQNGLSVSPGGTTTVNFSLSGATGTSACFRNDIERTGNSSLEGILNPTAAGFGPVWSYATGGSVNSTPAVVNGVLCVGSDDGKIYGLNASTGAPLWSHATGGPVKSSPAVSGGKVYVGSDDNKFYALNAATGAAAWSFTTGDKVRSSPLVVGNSVVFGSNDDKLYCVNATTGGEIWNSAGAGDIDAPPQYINAYWGGLELISVFDHTGAWMLRNLADGLNPGAPPYSVDGTTNNAGIIEITPAPGPLAELYVYQPASGLVTGFGKYNLFGASYPWSLPAGAPYSSSPAYDGTPSSMNGSYLYIGGADGKLYKLPKATGIPSWSFDAGAAIETSPALANGYVYIAADKKVFGVDQSTGASVWSYTLPGAIKSSPVPANGMLYVGSNDNTIVAFGTTTTTTTSTTTTTTPGGSTTTTTTSTTTTTIRPTCTITRDGAAVQNGDVIPVRPVFRVIISSPSVPVTSATITLGTATLATFSGSTTEVDQRALPTTDLTPGRYNLTVQWNDANGLTQVREITGLIVDSGSGVVGVPTVTITPGSGSVPASISLDFQCSGTGTAVFVIEDPGPPPQVLMDTRVNMTIGRNAIASQLITSTGSRFPKGVFNWKLLFNGRLTSGSFIVS
jgi:outer membrane protein assembly factor BamB